MVTLLIVWGAIPFVTITVYAGSPRCRASSSRLPRSTAPGPLRVFRDVTFPILKPIFLILTSLSIIWDFGVFTQPYLLIGASHVDASNYLMGVYVYIEGYAHTDFGRGAAISLLMLLMVAVLSVFYVRRMVKMERRPMSRTAIARRLPLRAARRLVRRERRRRLRRRAWNLVGLAVFVVVVFPVFWMISTAFKPDAEINSFTPTWFSPTRRCSTSATRSTGPYFWDAVKNSLIIVGVDGRALDRARVPRGCRPREVPLHGTHALRRPDDRDPHAPAGGPRHPALRGPRASTT